MAPRDPELTIILPFYRKLREFKRVLPLNADFFSDPRCEVVVVMDDPQCERQVVELARRHPAVRFRVVVNDRRHDWRPPCRAYNVGIRHALGRYVLLGDPESVLLTDAVSLMLQALRDDERAMVLGRVAFARFADAPTLAPAELQDAFLRAESRMSTPLFYCSLGVSRERLEAIRGYNESLLKWGADDDNLRLRLMIAGARMAPVPEIRLLHLGFERRLAGHASRRVPTYTREEKRRIHSPRSAVTNRPSWGREFSRTAWDWRMG